MGGLVWFDSRGLLIFTFFFQVRNLGSERYTPTRNDSEISERGPRFPKDFRDFRKGSEISERFPRSPIPQKKTINTSQIKSNQIFSMAGHAEACIHQMLSNGRDYTLLLYLRFWDFLDTFPKGKQLKEFIEIEMQLRREQVESQEFHDRVNAEFNSRKIQDLAPKRMVHAYRKEELYQLMADANWPEPYFPYIIQMRPGVFIAFSTWQSGFRHIVYMTGCGFHEYQTRLLPCVMTYECQSVVPSRIIIDCDAYEKEFEGIMTLPELQEVMSDVPRWFVMRLVQIGAIDKYTTVKVVEKEKSRGSKASRHFIFNIVGMPRGDIANVLNRIFVVPFRLIRDQHRVSKNWKHVDPSTAEWQGLICDIATMHGSNQFSTVFVGKPGEKPPGMTWIQEIQYGDGEALVIKKAAPWSGQDHVPTHPDALEMLYMSCFSHPLHDMVPLNPQFMPLITLPVQVIILMNSLACYET